MPRMARRGYRLFGLKAAGMLCAFFPCGLNQVERLATYYQINILE